MKCVTKAALRFYLMQLMFVVLFVAHVATKAGIYSFISAFVLAAENKRPKWQILYITWYPDEDNYQQQRKQLQ